MLLWGEENQSNQDSDSHDSETETISREDENKRRKEIVDWVIEKCTEKESEISCLVDLRRHFRSDFVRTCVGKSESESVFND
jgi:hypothetical protein